MRIDVIPAGPKLLEENCITWSNGHTMSLVAMRHAFESAVGLEVSAQVTMPVAPRHVIALLKMVSFMDRPAARERDLIDVAHLLGDYVSLDDDRWFSDDVPAGLDFRETPSFLLGLDVGSLVNENEAAVVRRFLERVGERGASHATMVANGPWRRAPEELLLRLEAFHRGFSMGAASQL